jgi:hypothetical protein
VPSKKQVCPKYRAIGVTRSGDLVTRTGDVETRDRPWDCANLRDLARVAPCAIWRDGDDAPR